jgi:hypothetical protein
MVALFLCLTSSSPQRKGWGIENKKGRKEGRKEGKGKGRKGSTLLMKTKEYPLLLLLLLVPFVLLAFY